MGRKSLYKPEYAEQALKLSLLGAKDTDLAAFFHVPVSTLSNWKKRFPEFMEALKEGKDQADANVANSLYNRALGYKYKEQQAVKVKTPEGEKVEVVTVERQAVADTTACIFWLKNRQKRDWRDRQEVEQTGTVKLERIERVIVDDPPARIVNSTAKEITH